MLETTQTRKSVTDVAPEKSTAESIGKKSVSVIIPTLNAGPEFVQTLDALQSQTHVPQEIIVIDSGSDDATPDVAFRWGCRVKTIARTSFGHGETRNLGASLAGGEVLVFMTQDAIPADSFALDNLVGMLWKEHSAVAYGRQLPRADAKAQARHVRLFNYPRNSQVKTHDDIPRLGIKTAFCSNCFAAYTKTCFKDLGGFSTGLIFGEDMEFAARAIRSGRAVAYAADACVYHSHDYRIVQEFRRAFDIGVFHAQQPWILEYFGRAGGEGLRLIRSELRYLARHEPEGILPAVAANAAKFLGYTLGIRHAIIPGTWKKFLSMHGYFWVNG